MIHETENSQEAKSIHVRVSLRDMLKLIRVDTLRRDNNVSFSRGTAQILNSGLSDTRTCDHSNISF